MLCRGSIQWRREASAHIIKKYSNYFKSRHLVFMINLVSTTWRRHAVYKSAVLNFSPRTPCSAHFVCYSYRFRCLFYSNVSSLRSGHHRIFCHDSKRMWLKIVYIRGIWCHTRPSLEDVAQCKRWLNVPKWSKLQRISPAQGVESNGHCV